MNKWEQTVELNISLLSKKERKLSKEDLFKLVSSRCTKGWAFTGQSREDHFKDVELIRGVFGKLIG